MTFITPKTEPSEPIPAAKEKKDDSGFIPTLLCLILVVLSIDLYFRFEERQSRAKDEASRKEIVQAMIKTSSEIDTKRMEVLTDYVKGLDAPETKSVYHQIYLASFAQLKMQNLAVQEQQLLIQILAGKN